MTFYRRLRNKEDKPVYEFNLSDGFVLMMGLDDAGKTAILNRIALDKFQPTNPNPTMSFNLETVKLGLGFQPMKLWDVGGLEHCRMMWPHYLESEVIHGIVFVIDGSVPERIEEKEEFQTVLRSGNTRVPILVLLNKSDMPVSFRTLTEVTESLQLNALQGRLWHIQACSAQTGAGLKEGFQEIYRMIKMSMECREQSASCSSSSTLN